MSPIAISETLRDVLPSKGGPVRQRHDIRELQRMFDAGDKKPLSDLLRAWKGIQELPPTDPNSFFMIAGYHGEPFRGAGYSNPQWWGGYCNHGNILFPTWHRAYLYRLENALRSIPGCENVALAYWDEVDDENLVSGVPSVFLRRRVELDDRTTIDNPLFSYTFQSTVFDALTEPKLTSQKTGKDADGQISNPDYTKKAGYKTVRYPYSGLMAKDDPDVVAYNAKIEAMGEEKVNMIFNEHIQKWLVPPKTSSKGDNFPPVGIKAGWLKCLDTPNYTLFSNKTSSDHSANVSDTTWVPLEGPHNSMHLAIGGFNVPGQGDANEAEYSHANGDMGENDTASFDPIFYFHHAFVDKVFWDWQTKWSSQDELEVIEGFPGTNSVDSQGPTPGVAGGTWLTLDSPLDPFKLDDKPGNRAATSKDVINIERQLNYTYVTPSHMPRLGAPINHQAAKYVAKVSSVNRGTIGGSFIIAAYNKDGELVNYQTYLNRWHTAGCANCQTHLNIKAVIPLHGVEDHDRDQVETRLIPRTNRSGNTLVGNDDVPQVEHRIHRIR